MLKETVQLNEVYYVIAQSVFQLWEDINKKKLETVSRNVTFNSEKTLCP